MKLTSTLVMCTLLMTAATGARAGDARDAEALRRADKATASITKAGPRQRVGCVLQKLGAPGAVDGAPNANLIAPALKRAGDMTLDQIRKAVDGGIKPIAPQLRTLVGQTDAGIAKALAAIDDGIGLSLDTIAKQAGGSDAAALAWATAQSVMSQLQANPRHVLSCYAGYTRSRHDEIAGAGSYTPGAGNVW